MLRRYARSALGVGLMAHRTQRLCHVAAAAKSSITRKKRQTSWCNVWKMTQARDLALHFHFICSAALARIMSGRPCSDRFIGTCLTATCSMLWHVSRLRTRNQKREAGHLQPNPEHELHEQHQNRIATWSRFLDQQLAHSAFHDLHAGLYRGVQSLLYPTHC